MPRPDGPGSRFAGLLSGSSNLASAFRHATGGRIQAAGEQATSVFRPPAGRLVRVLLDLAGRHGVQAPDGITIPVGLSQAELAGMIGVSRSATGPVLPGAGVPVRAARLTLYIYSRT